MTPDVVLVGFDLTAEDAVGSLEVGNEEKGWFFVFRERAGDIRFGMDEPVPGDDWSNNIPNWDELTWGHIGGSETNVPNDLNNINYIHLDDLNVASDDIGPQGEEVKWGVNAANMAHIVFKKPVLIAIHGSDMIGTLI